MIGFVRLSPALFLSLLAAIGLATWAGCGSEAASECETCAGCCDDGRCLPGTTNEACGAQGGNCFPCQTGTLCQAGRCLPGGSTGDCGCLDNLTLACRPGTTNDACGNTGGVCASCPAGQNCVGGQCQGNCSFLTCLGCCANGVCFETVGPAACGAAGSECIGCGPGQDCVLGECSSGQAQSCNSSNCSGCCHGSSCLSGTSASACGVAGGVCKTCTSGSICSAGDCQVSTQSCSSQTCSGCCDRNDNCIPTGSQSDSSCGQGGEACYSCTTGSCSGGSCSGSNPCLNSCSGGCCTDGGACLRFDSDPLLDQQSDSACGTFGLCRPCDGGLECIEGRCVGNPLWRVLVRTFTVGQRQPTGEEWDIGSGPDPYATALVSGSFFSAGTLWPPLDDTWTPNFDSQSNPLLITATELDLGTKGLEITVRDSDFPFESPWDDIAGTCTLIASKTMLESGSTTISHCGDAVTQLQLRFTRN